MLSINYSADRARFKDLLKQEGLFEAVRFLNSKSVHRFTALYVFDGPMLRNVCLVDKENDSVRQMDTIEITESYCVFVRNSGQTFIVPDSLVDERVQGHPKQATIQSYCGLPLLKSSGTQLVGTVCHFDFTPNPYSDDEVLLLEMVTPALVDALESSSLAEPEPIKSLAAKSGE